jgi:AcrR family transcriptional regulator
MSAYEATGRTNQKRRTRQALVDKATELVRQGRKPTVAEVAEAALISKSTAYRYFPSQDLLLAEVALDEILNEELAALYAMSEQPGSPQERLDAVIRGDFVMQLRHEDAIRQVIAKIIARTGPRNAERVRRPGNRLRYVAQALDDVREQLGEERFQRMLHAIAMCMGIESVIVLMDICGLSEEEAQEVRHWATQALLDASINEASD